MTSKAVALEALEDLGGDQANRSSFVASILLAR